MTRTFQLKNINANVGDKIVILGNDFAVMPWQYPMPLAAALVDSAYLGFVPAGTYSVTAIAGGVGFPREYSIQGPM